MMKLMEAAFVTSAAKPSDWPPATLPEIAFCGRSNVGKSTLLNHLLARKGMARVSRTPGRTRLINFFKVQAKATLTEKAPESIIEFFLVDLPGFGYAQVSRAERDDWRPTVEAYFETRTSLASVIVLFDSRRVCLLEEDPLILQEEEALFFYLMGLQKQVLPVITKIDQISKHKQKPMIERLQARLGKKVLSFSSLTGEGVLELQKRIGSMILKTFP